MYISHATSQCVIERPNSPPFALQGNHLSPVRFTNNYHKCVIGLRCHKQQMHNHGVHVLILCDLQWINYIKKRKKQLSTNKKYNVNLRVNSRKPHHQPFQIIKQTPPLPQFPCSVNQQSMCYFYASTIIWGHISTTHQLL